MCFRFRKEIRKQLEVIEKNGPSDHTLVDVISKISHLDNTRAGTHFQKEIYIRIPKLMFRFRPDVDKKIYYEIKDCLESFKGNLEWSLYFEENQPPKRYYIIIPKLYCTTTHFVEGKRPEDKKDETDYIYESELYGEEVYKDTCDKAIEDIPLLAKHLEQHFLNSETT